MFGRQGTPLTQAPHHLEPWNKPRSLLLLAAWYGLSLGTIEALTLVILHHFRLCVLDRISPYIWTIPLADALVMLAIVLIPWIWARTRSKRVTPRLRAGTVFICTFLAVATFIAMGDMLHVALQLWAGAILCAGCGVVTARFVAKRVRSVHLWMKRTAPLLAAAAIVCGLITSIRFARNEREAIASLPPAAADAPNLLVIVADTLRAKSMSLYGYPRDTTPNLQRWAGHGIVFDHAVSTSPFTLTSHAGMFTGRYPTELSAGWATPLDSGPPTLAEALRARGYFTIGIAANFWNAGVQSGLQRGFAHYQSHRLALGEMADRSTLCRLLLNPPRPLMRAEEVNGRFLHYLGAHPQRPFFAFLNYNDCHATYDPETPFDQPEQRYPFSAKRSVAMWCMKSYNEPHPETDQTKIAAARDAYDACVQGLDRNINQLLSSLEDRGVLKNTLVVIVADHGEQFGEHHLVQHADSLYRPAIHVPLIILPPGGAPAARRVHPMVTLRDLPATLLELLHCPACGIPGDSFAAAVSPQGDVASLPAGPKYAYIEKGINYTPWHPNAAGPVSAVFLEERHYITNGLTEEMYDFASDPDEARNLVNDPSLKELADRCRALAASPPGRKR